MIISFILFYFSDLGLDSDLLEIFYIVFWFLILFCMFLQQQCTQMGSHQMHSKTFSTEVIIVLVQGLEISAIGEMLNLENFNDGEMQTVGTFYIKKRTPKQNVHIKFNPKFECWFFTLLWQSFIYKLYSEVTETW